MGNVSKNARVGSGVQKHLCPCGGEVKMKSIFSNGRMKHVAFCEKCKREERKPKDFR